MPSPKSLEPASQQPQSQALADRIALAITGPAGKRLAPALALRLLCFAALTALAFPPFHLGPVIFIALVPYFDAVRLAEEAQRGRRTASALLYLGGALHFGFLLYWILFLPPEETTVPWIVPLAFAVMCAYLAVYPFAAQWAGRRAVRAGMPIELALALAWVGGEYLRSQSQLGFPWVLAGYGLIETPHLVQFMSETGIFGASLFVALVNGCVFAALRRRGRARLRWLAAAAALPILALLQGTIALSQLGAVPTREVLIVQGNIGRDIKFKPEHRIANLQRMLALSDSGLAAAPTRPALIVWPETAAPCYVLRDRVCREVLEDFVNRAGVPLLTGTPDLERSPDGERRYANAAVVITPGEGVTGLYQKVNLVPFGEAIPYQEKLPFLQRIDFGEADFVRGSGFIPVAAGPDRVGIMICFESIFSEIGGAYARAGARYLVNITNDEWFGPSGGPYQHASMAVARAIETRRGLVRAANTGVSFVVDRGGRTTHATGLFTPAVVRAPVELGDRTTVYMRIGDLAGQAALALVALAALLGILRPRRPAARPLDPRLALLTALLLTILVMALAPSAMAPLAVALFAASLAIPGGRRRFLLLAAGTAVFALVLNAATTPGEPRLTLGPLSFSSAGWAAGGERALRLLGLFGLARLVHHLVPAADLAEAVEWAVRPIERVVPRAAGLGLALGLALRFLPEIESEAARIRLAQRARPPRRAATAARAPWTRFAARRLAPLEPFFLPLLAGAVRRAEEVARTLDARGYGSGPRTARFAGLGARGWIVATGMVATTALLLWTG